MKSTWLAAVIMAASEVMMVQAATGTTASTTTRTKGVEEAASTPVLGDEVVQGCFTSAGELVLNSSQLYNSKSKCARDICAAMGKAVAGTTGGQYCYCGDKYPPKDTLTNDTACNIGCTGYDIDACGGLNTWTIYNTGLELAVENSEDTVTSSSSSTTIAAAATVMTVGGSTIVVTATSSPQTNDAASNGGGGSNVTGIAVGVSVAVLAIAAIIGGLFFYMRRRRNQEIEEEHRRNAAANAFMNGKPPGTSGGSLITDARLDPVMAQRRMSSGSIADNQDYSRRILRVTNA